MKSEVFDTIIGKVCLERGWIAQAQFFDCLRECGLGTAQASGQKGSLSDILVKRGLITGDQMGRLRREVSSFLSTGKDYVAAQKEDTLLRHLLRTGGHLSREDLDRALDIQRSAAGRGAPVPRLAEVLLREGLIGFDVIYGLLASRKTQEQENPLEAAAERASASRDDGETVSMRNLIPGYELVAQLGHGGMGAVYKAHQMGLDRWVAVKLMRKILAQDSDYLRRFILEAQTAGRLRHENIVSALDCGESHGRYYIVMEYVEGWSLHEILKKRKKLTETEALVIVKQVADGLDHAWQHKVVHRDIKSRNIMIMRNGVAKICDLGLCRDVRSLSSHTVSGAIQCTPSYASPEQARGEKGLDTRTDIYSLGVTFYEMVAGTLPFRGEAVGDVLIRQATEKPLPPIVHTPSLSPAVNQLILHMMEKSKADRPSSPGAVSERIAEIMGVGSRPVQVDSAPPVPTPPPRPALAPSTRRESPAGRERGRKTRLQRDVLIGIIVLGIIAILAVAALTSGPRKTSKASGPARSSGASVHKDSGAEQFDPDRLSAAEEALKAARAVRNTTPIDPSALHAAYESAVWACDRTPLLEEAKAEQARVVGEIEEALRPFMAQADTEVRRLWGQEEFRQALDFMSSVKSRFKVPAWNSFVTVKLAGLHESSRDHYLKVEAEALAALRRRDEETLRRIRERIQKWGLPEFVATLEEALREARKSKQSKSGAPPSSPPPVPPPPVEPPPSPAPAPAAVEPSPPFWERAMAHARVRDFAAGRKELESAAEGGRAAEDLSSDLHLLEQASRFYEEARKAFFALPMGKPVTLRYRDRSGDVVEASGRLREVDEYRADVEGAFGSAVVELGELSPASLVEVHRSRKGADPQADAVGAALFCILEGEPDAAKLVAGPSSSDIPDKYWTFARRVVAERAKPDPERQARERQARALFYDAHSEFGNFASQASAVGKYKLLLKAFADTAVVRRNRASIVDRTEGGREYVYFARDLSPLGAFRLSKEPEVGYCWLSMEEGNESSLWRNGLEFVFSNLPGTAYQCWVYVGACCRETFEIHLQATDLSRSGRKPIPGSTETQRVKHWVRNLKDRHADHGGRQRPERWEWVKIRLPAYETSGPKHVRILSARKGFAMAFALVSSRRRFPPGFSEKQEWVRLQAEGATSQRVLESRPTGKILREWWLGLQGNELSKLTGSPDYPFHPSGKGELTAFEAPANWGNRYGQRIRGFVYPPATGNYVFWIAGDDECELWLSTDDGPVRREKIAEIRKTPQRKDAHTKPRVWNKYVTQKSRPIPLVAGRRYYIEAIHKEGEGEDNLAVGWQLPDQTYERPIPGTRLSPFIPMAFQAAR